MFGSSRVRKSDHEDRDIDWLASSADGEESVASKRTNQVTEFGDFQTPSDLARQVCATPSLRRLRPASILEPTCGVGNILVTALTAFGSVRQAIGLDINHGYVKTARRAVSEAGFAGKADVLKKNLFETDLASLFQTLPDPLLVIGNPPWVTNAELGALGSANLPAKSNFQERSGFDALTGKSNFDISEWMLSRLLECLNGRRATLAMLCKTAVARKVLLHAWKNRMTLERSEMRRINAVAHFGARVDACLLICRLRPASRDKSCFVYDDLAAVHATAEFGFRDGSLISNTEGYDRWHHLQGNEVRRWRSGAKHDCAKVMEFRREGDRYRNGFGELVELENEYVFPLLKSSELAKGRIEQPTRWMLVTQRKVGDDTEVIRDRAPKTWQYLSTHGDRLDRRGSSIYRNRPRFSVFGIGDYTFANWKVGISGFYKRLRFTEIGSFEGKPIVLDDTSYFVACRSKQEAKFVTDLLNSDVAREFYDSFIFWDAKRPITVDVLRRLDLYRLARECGIGQTPERFRDLPWLELPANPVRQDCCGAPVPMGRP